MDEAAGGLDLDFQDGTVVGAGKRSEGLATALTATLLGGQVALLLGGGEVGVIASAVAGTAPALAAAAGRLVRRPGRLRAA